MLLSLRVPADDGTALLPDTYFSSTPMKMAGPWIVTFLCGFLGATLVQADLRPPAVLNLGPEVIKEHLTQALKNNHATAILHELPLLSAMRDRSGSIPMLDSLVQSFLRYIIWMKVTSANILQLAVQPSAYDQELVVRIPLDMVSGLNTPLVKTMVQFQMNTEIQALIRVEKSKSGPAHLNLSDCSSSSHTLRLSLLNKLSFMVNSLANKVMNILVPALPQMVKNHLCPVIQQAFNDMYNDFLRLATAPIPLSPGALDFGLLSPAIQDSNIVFNLKAKLLDSQARVTKWFNSSVASQMETTPRGAPFSLLVRQDLVNAIVDTLVPKEELVILLRFVIPEVARQLQADINEINAEAANKLGPTQMVKIATYSSPQIVLNEGGATAAQNIILEVFPTNTDVRPFFSLGIETNYEARFFTEGDRLMLNFNNISIDRIKLMISNIKLFNPESMKGTLTKILEYTLLPNENGKLRTGIPMSLVKALGYEKSVWSVTKGALKLTPDSS
ncbi:long palate, lung and nasal epithelium carcinoma-associated protein 1 [Cricetulus griseus]|uniref:Long palate, lung and nasal epithelium carcinoma-associated protein 1 n=2 Tax=Cricetulus griseus TaxID=10029 RepID=A0A061HXI5_CRIGR|nr:long palate, lung and nasal epithelium carcinoma-associated protein 1 [Cricetulus griseus]